MHISRYYFQDNFIIFHETIFFKVRETNHRDIELKLTEFVLIDKNILIKARQQVLKKKTF